MKFMKSIPACFFILWVLSGCGDHAPVSPENITDSLKLKKVASQRIEILKPEALNILDSSAVIEVLAKGFKWTEGPLYIADGNFLLFSDIPNNKVYKWKEGADTSIYLFPSGHTYKEIKHVEPGSNGLILNAAGKLVLMQHGDRRLAIMDAPLSAPMPHYKTLVDRYKGKRLNSPNDAVLAANGNIYFTDPPYGLDERLEDTAKQLTFQGVYCLRPNGELILLTDELKFPNGIALSPDGHFLYADNSDPANKLWMKYELDEKGLIRNKSVFYRAVADEGKDNGSPDGMKVNKAGYLFTAAPGGIWIFNPSGVLVARINIEEKTANCAFGRDQKELFITSSSSLLRVKLK